MQITCDALKLHLFIYQCHKEHIQVLSFHQQNAEHSRHIAASERVVRVRFTHNNLNTGGNHYDAITCIHPSEPDFNDVNLSAPNLTPPEIVQMDQEFEQLNKKRNRLSKKKSSSTNSNVKPVFINLTESDDEIFLHNSPQAEKCTVKQETTDSYSDTTDTTDWTDLEPFSSSSTLDTVTSLENVQSKGKRSYSINTPTTTSTTDSNEETKY